MSADRIDGQQYPHEELAPELREFTPSLDQAVAVLRFYAGRQIH